MSSNIYTFGKDGITFYVNFPPDRNLKKQVENLFSGYDLYAHMKDFNTESIKETNKDILDTVYSMGIFKITQSDSFGKNVVTLFEEVPKHSFLRSDRILYFKEYKLDYPRVGLISYVDNITKNKPSVIFTEWLPRMIDINVVTSIANWDTRYDILSCNIIQYKGISYFVLFEYGVDLTWEVSSYVEIGEGIFQKDSMNFLNRTKMLQINSMNQNIDAIFRLWCTKFNERRILCGLESMELNFYDILIYLYQFQEFISKVEPICDTNTLMWTDAHNEFNNEFRDFKFHYDSDIRREILNAFDLFNAKNSKKEKAYAFINDFFAKGKLID